MLPFSKTAFTFTFNFNYKQADTRLFDKFAIGIKQNGKYVLLSDCSYITNPEARAQYQYAYPKAASIKGLLVDPNKLKGGELSDLGDMLSQGDSPDFAMGELDAFAAFAENEMAPQTEGQAEPDNKKKKKRQ